MRAAPTWVIVPVKSLAEVKQRLAAILPPEARRRLLLTMFEDVLATLRQVDGLGPVLVVTPDAQVAEIAERSGALVLREARGRGHSAAACAGFGEALVQGATHAVTLPADVPLATPGELRSLIETAIPPDGPCVTLVPSHDGDGTNALLVSPPDAFEPKFGPGSFARHLAQAHGITCKALPLAGLGRDIDMPGDLAALIHEKQADPRYAFLETYCRLSETVGAGQR